MYKKYNVRTDKTVSTAILIISVAFTVKILPKKNTLALAFNLPELISVIAVPMLIEMVGEVFPQELYKGTADSSKDECS